MSEGLHAVAAMTSTFMIGVLAGVAVLVGVSWLNPEAATLVFDWSGDGIGLCDALIPAWFLGHMALIVHHILPGIARA